MVSPPQRPQSQGYINMGCRCLLCKASHFSAFVVSPAMPGFKLKIPHTLTCKSGPGLVYHAVCHSGKQHCKLAHYVGRTFTNDKVKYPMRNRWSIHKSHFNTSYNGCKLTEHLLQFHKGEDPQKFVKITLLDKADTLEEVLELELQWTRRLYAFHPSGLNTRKEEIYQDT